MVKKLRQHVKPFSFNTGTRWTDRQNCYINIAVSVLMRNKNIFRNNNKQKKVPVCEWPVSRRRRHYRRVCLSWSREQHGMTLCSQSVRCQMHGREAPHLTSPSSPSSYHHHRRHHHHHHHHHSSSSRMHVNVMNHNWSATKQRLHPQSVAEISCHSVSSGDGIQQCGTSSGSRRHHYKPMVTTNCSTAGRLDVQNWDLLRLGSVVSTRNILQSVQ